jgi:hypothetical protein
VTLDEAASWSAPVVDPGIDTDNPVAVAQAIGRMEHALGRIEHMLLAARLYSTDVATTAENKYSSEWQLSLSTHPQLTQLDRKHYVNNETVLTRDTAARAATETQSLAESLRITERRLSALQSVLKTHSRPAP